MNEGVPAAVRILAVDDEQEILDLYRRFLCPESSSPADEHFRQLQTRLFGEQPAFSPELGVDLVLNRQGDEAVETVRAAVAEGRPFSLVFLDVRMPPGPDGVTTARQIRALDQDLEIVIVTGYSDVHPHQIAHLVPPPAKLFYLQKPVHAQEIQQLASALGAKWRAERQVAAHTAELIRLNQQLEEDIAARKRAEEEKDRLQAQLRQKQKMEALGTLAGGVAHDFNNILAAIIGYTELTLLRQKNQSIRSHLAQVLLAARRGEKLVRQILTFSRRSEHEPEVIDLGAVVKECLELLSASLPPNISIRQELAQPSLVLADANQLHQVVMNLGTNAAHAMQEHGGTMTVALSTLDLDATAVACWPELTPGTYHRLTVSDTGHGIDSSILERVFEPFFTTKERGQGTGMGLAVAHGIVRDCGGVISVTSEPGAGATFQVLLPQAKGEAVADAKPLIPMITGGNERILLIDDEQPLVELGAEVLQVLGYQVVGMTSPGEALALFTSDPQRFDLIITDLTMPETSGHALSREIRSIRPDIPVILCTGFLEEAQTDQVMADGISEVLKKPFSVHDISGIIRRVLDSRS
jgi:signal transduction histidine kinase